MNGSFLLDKQKRKFSLFFLVDYLQERFSAYIYAPKQRGNGRFCFESLVNSGFAAYFVFSGPIISSRGAWFFWGRGRGSIDLSVLKSVSFPCLFALILGGLCA